VAGVRQERKTRTRDRLIDAAISVFARDGLLAARTLDIAREAGVSHGTVFCALRRFLERAARRTRELAEEGHGVRHVLAAHLRGIAENEAFYTRLAKEGHLLPPSARSVLLGIQSAFSHHLSKASEREIAEGRIRRVPHYMIFNGWLGLVHHYLIWSENFAPGRSVIEVFGPDLVDYYVGLLQTENSGGQRP